MQKQEKDGEKKQMEKRKRWRKGADGEKKQMGKRNNEKKEHMRKGTPEKQTHKNKKHTKGTA